jgi:hypothetical protein
MHAHSALENSTHAPSAVCTHTTTCIQRACTQHGDVPARSTHAPSLKGGVGPLPTRQRAHWGLATVEASSPLGLSADKAASPLEPAAEKAAGPGAARAASANCSSSQVTRSTHEWRGHNAPHHTRAHSVQPLLTASTAREWSTLVHSAQHRAHSTHARSTDASTQHASAQHARSQHACPCTPAHSMNAHSAHALRPQGGRACRRPSAAETLLRTTEHTFRQRCEHSQLGRQRPLLGGPSPGDCCPHSTRCMERARRTRPKCAHTARAHTACVC